MDVLLASVSKEDVEPSLLREEVQIPVELQFKSFSECLESNLKMRTEMRKQSGLISSLS